MATPLSTPPQVEESTPPSSHVGRVSPAMENLRMPTANPLSATQGIANFAQPSVQLPHYNFLPSSSVPPTVPQAVPPTVPQAVPPTVPNYVAESGVTATSRFWAAAVELICSVGTRGAIFVGAMLYPTPLGNGELTPEQKKKIFGNTSYEDERGCKTTITPDGSQTREGCGDNDTPQHPENLGNKPSRTNSSPASSPDSTIRNLNTGPAPSPSQVAQPGSGQPDELVPDKEKAPKVTDPSFVSEEVAKKFAALPVGVQNQVLESIAHDNKRIIDNASVLRSKSITQANEYLQRYGSPKIQEVEERIGDGKSSSRYYVVTTNGSYVIDKPTKANSPEVVSSPGLLPIADIPNKVSRLLSNEDMQSLKATHKIIPKDQFSLFSEDSHISKGSSANVRTRYISASNAEPQGSQPSANDAYWRAHKKLKECEALRGVDTGTVRLIAQGMKKIAADSNGQKPSPKELAVAMKKFFACDSDGNLWVATIDTGSLYGDKTSLHPGAIQDGTQAGGGTNKNKAKAVGELLLDTPYVPESAMTIRKVSIDAIAEFFAGSDERGYVRFGESEWRELSKLGKKK